MYVAHQMFWDLSCSAVAYDKSIISYVTGLKGQKKTQELWQPYSQLLFMCA